MKIYGKTISKETIDLIISEVQSKKEYSNFSETYILKYAEHLLKKNKKLLELVAVGTDLSKKKLFQTFIKEIREKVRRIYGVYITKNYNKREKLLLDKDLDGLLRVHLSTKERVRKYKEIYSKIIEMTIKPKSVLDLACGFNPLAQGILGKVEYNASDISEKDVEFLKKCYSKFNFKGEVFRADLSESTEHDKLKKFNTDWCLLFKALDPIEESNEDISYKLIPSIKSKWIIVSFPTLTISRKKMRNPKRSWFEKVLDRTERSFETFETEDEVFYVIKNQ